jgi:large subunit ribosomal protein L24
MALHVKQGDLVCVRTGNDKGKTGKVLRVMPADLKVIVEGVNVRVRHVKPSQKNPQGGRVDKPMPIHISNVMPVGPSAPKGTRVRFQVQPDGSKVRVAAKGGQVLSTLYKSK